MESNLRGLEIKDQMVGVESLDLNTSVGGSLSKMDVGSGGFILVALSESRRWVGVYIDFTKNPTVTHFYAQLGGTKNKSRRHQLVQKIRTLDISMGPDESTRWGQFVMT